MLLCFREDEFKSPGAFLTNPVSHRAVQLLQILSETHCLSPSIFIASRCPPTQGVSLFSFCYAVLEQVSLKSDGRGYGHYWMLISNTIALSPHTQRVVSQVYYPIRVWRTIWQYQAMKWQIPSAFWSASFPLAHFTSYFHQHIASSCFWGKLTLHKFSIKTGQAFSTYWKSSYPPQILLTGSLLRWVPQLLDQR